MTTNQNDEEVLDEKLNDLLKRAEEVNKKMDDSSIAASAELSQFEETMDQNIKDIEGSLSELDIAEEETAEEMNKLILEEAEDMANDDKEEEEEDKEE
jgi:hypothetical protein